MRRLKDDIGRIRPDGRHGVDPRGKRRRQGVGRPGDPFQQSRKAGPFVVSQLRGIVGKPAGERTVRHEKGSFTGPTNRKIGKFEQAHKGSLMLDEVGEMSPAIQAKFLRVLEGHPFERVGGGESVKVDVRVVAATNRDLEEAVEKGLFRKDCTSVCKWLSCASTRSGNAATISPRSRSSSWRSSSRRRVAPCAVTPRGRWRNWSITIGPAMFASCRTRSSGR